MKDIKLLAKELLSLTNKSECDESTIERMKNLICYLSEHKKNYQGSEEDKNRLDYIIYTACVKMRTFGYNRLNGFKVEDFIGDNLSEVKENAILKYYGTATGFVLDRLQKDVLDSYEENNQKLFLSAPTSFGKTFLLKQIIYNNYKKYNNIVIVLPTVALLMEVTEDLNLFLKQSKLFYHIHNSIYRDLEISEKNIFVLTPERVLRMLAIFPDITVDFFFYDEIYKIDEDITVECDDDSPNNISLEDNSYQNERTTNHRACAFRLALYYLLEKSNACYISGPFIKIDKLKSGFKNMLLRYGIGTMEIHFEPTLKNKIDFHGQIFRIQSPIENETIKTTEKDKFNKLHFIVNKLNITKHNSAIVYCLYPSHTEKNARKYCEKLPIDDNKLINMFVDHVSRNFNCKYGREKNSIEAWDFIYALKRGIGIHNGKFPKYFQREIMSLFNQKQMPLLFCTSTIVEGVNTNAKTVIVYHNPSGENDAGKRFLLLNINGRAGRYLRHFVGNIVYLNRECLKIESSENISLDFKLFSDEVLLGDVDLENVENEHLSSTNLERKKRIELDRDLLPDKVFSQNRLIERVKQEKILREICSSVGRFNGIEKANIMQFINDGYFDAILEVWAKVGEIKDTQISGIKYFSKKYAEDGYLGVLKYRFDRPPENSLDSENLEKKFVNDTYRTVFRNVKDTIEYQLPRILSLFETLINRAFELKGVSLGEPLDLSKIIRYFEVGAKTLLGTDMIEKGVPIITVRKIEKRFIDGDTLEEQREFFNARYFQFTMFLDEYEREMISRYRNGI
ncbi:DEAD/DEAH box helicase [uncultured Eubacterium sp.]|uniref:DEAD/DEAH box helicase n=1 Tax=uncultured Eubacterium sp. TaxID=165185 RepID=UPI0026391365|nr:DEAD/DEAH box helicase [uncultured Eubacterium sp.]